MTRLLVRDHLTDAILVSRESARLLQTRLEAAIREATAGDQQATADATVDFAGVRGMAPSFVDELVTIFESVLQTVGGRQTGRLIIANPPTRLSSKFEAIARGHQMTIRVLPDNSWLLCDAGDAAAG